MWQQFPWRPFSVDKLTTRGFQIDIIFLKKQLDMSMPSNPLDVILDEDEEVSEETTEGEPGEGEDGAGAEEEADHLSGDDEQPNE